MPIIINPDDGPFLGPGLGYGQSYFYVPNIIAIRDTPDSIENIATVPLSFGTTILVIYNGQAWFWRLVGGPANALTPKTECQPLDYDPTSPAHWELVCTNGVQLISVATTTDLYPDTSAGNFYDVSALASAMTIQPHTGVIDDGQELIIRIKDNGTARA